MSAPSATDTEIAAAVARLRSGGLVAFPTETVYGLGADAANADAVRAVFRLKGRPPAHPVIVHLPDACHLPRWARDVPPWAQRLAERLWPGPLTLVLARGAAVSDVVTGGQDSVGLRVPAHPLAQRLLAAFAGGVAAPSANRYGHLSPTTAEHVRAEFGAETPLVLDGGPCPVGIESTIVDARATPLRLLRPGSIARRELEEVAGVPVADRAVDSPRVPGSDASHYAPTAPLEIVVTPEELAAALEQAAGARVKVGVLALDDTADANARRAAYRWRPMPLDAARYAQQLYAALRELESADCGLIVVQRPPLLEGWEAVHDRLQRAAGHRRGG
ncbi:MAG: L-threonylcarbamoyladenylate synthase [Steroidobacteraceae bacterium]|nr:L-threonylcarbamoyladenylate synthase [Steroidobacteraceae bacterium]MDW8260325.1 L-threonylcarbamoyladenylate synthase [Gammaproteobacteria bacterium]